MPEKTAGPPLERRNGADRRRGLPQVRSRALEIYLAVVATATIAALFFALTAQGNAISASRFDTCELLRGLVFAATPKAQLARATAYIQATPLHNCSVYANNESLAPPGPTK